MHRSIASLPPKSRSLIMLKTFLCNPALITAATAAMEQKRGNNVGNIILKKNVFFFPIVRWLASESSKCTKKENVIRRCSKDTLIERASVRMGDEAGSNSVRAG